MINLVMKPNFRLPKSCLINGFIMIFIILSVTNLPANLMRNYLNQSTIYFENVSGTIWNAQFQDIIIAGEYWSELNIAVQKPPLLTGTLKSHFRVSNGNSIFEGYFQENDEEEIVLSSLKGSTTVQINQNTISYSSLLNLRADTLILNRDGTCLEGRIDLNSDFLKSFLARFSLDMPMLEGQGECLNGVFSGYARSSKNGVEIALKGDLTKDDQMMTIDIELPENMSGNINVINELTANKFVKYGEVWRSTMEISQ